jgi:hypothetical protein
MLWSDIRERFGVGFGAEMREVFRSGMSKPAEMREVFRAGMSKAESSKRFSHD